MSQSKKPSRQTNTEQRSVNHAVEEDEFDAERSVQNMPLVVGAHGDLTIEGYSRAAVQTCWKIPELKILLDLGVQPWDFMGIPTALVTHTHLDHIAALAVYVSRRRMMKMDPPTIYLPAPAVAGCERLLKLFSQLDRGLTPCHFIGVEPGDEISLSRELVMNVVATRHTIPSVGFVISQRRHKLKPEFHHLSGNEIRELKLQGVEITSEIRMPLLGYTGDTAPQGLDQNPLFFEAKVLITEMTFVAPQHRREKIHKHGHMHLDDFVERREQFVNQRIIASHFSTRYSDAQIRRWVKRRIPDMFGDRLQLWL